MEEKMMQLPESIYDELCRTLTDFERDANDDTPIEQREYFLSDGEWLDVFYDLAVKIQNGIVQ